ncbi:transcription factor IIIB 90 kDa subunit-like [Saccoglossus kowalevskii]|uniref:B-related factor 1 n=1 Tax=Saccoglossus kowalevskii TaxID=10224 RepID=A0ABM0MKM7_SACKO|nr:PREDICTED: transcription factor IIIB 90 kDa subunit-like [Saccoglossus kowalevskii]
MSKRVCPNCGGSDIDVDQARGNAVCVACGSVLEDNIIVSEVNFAENSLGGTSVIGQYVSAEGGKSHSLGSSFHHGFGKESRAVTLLNGKRKIQSLGAQLKLNQHCIDTAYNFFKMAVSKRLTRGRKTSHVVSACLYLVCRTEGTPHMLLDFSDILQVNVYVLGKTYLKLSTELHINVPAIDPCLYIPRFAHKLEFGDKTHDVSMTALRLVSRMKRDWMHTGRRPSGLCGAALLVSARLHDFNRTQKEIIRVVKVCDATLRKRLTEFEETPSSRLTIDEFQKIDLEEEQDPPAFTNARRKAKKAQFGEACKLPELEGEISCVQEEIEKALHKKHSKNPNLCEGSLSQSDDSQDVQETSQFVEEEILQQVEEETEILQDAKEEAVAESAVMQEPVKDCHVDDDVDDDVGIDNHCTNRNNEELDTLLLSEASWEGAYSGPRPSAVSLGLTQTIEECMQVPEEESVPEDDGELDLTGIDDSELEKFILSDNEVELKTEIWMKENAEYLKQQKEKEEKEQRDRELGISKPESKKKRKYKKRVPFQANTAGEAIEKMLQEKKISSKINYDVLRDLNRESDCQGSSKSPPKQESIPESTMLSPSPSPIATTKSRMSSGTMKRIQPNVNKRKTDQSQVTSSKMARLETNFPESLKNEDAVVVESGPVTFDNSHLEDEDADYYEEEEGEPVSALQLMGHSGLDSYHDYDMDDME